VRVQYGHDRVSGNPHRSLLPGAVDHHDLPLIGNYGVNPEDVESAGVQAEAFLLKEYLPFPSNYRSQGSLGDYLKESGVLGLEGIDTRALTRHLRNFGAMRSAASTEVLDPEP